MNSVNHMHYGGRNNYRNMQFKSCILKRVENEFNVMTSNPIDNFEFFKYPVKPLQWHFIFHGPKGTPFETGEYHGDIFFKNEFPLNPPVVIFCTYNGRLLKDRGINIIEPKWWNSSMSIQDIFKEINRAFIDGTPRPPVAIFE